MEGPPPPPGILAIQTIVRDALAPYGDGAAEVEFGWRRGWNAWVLEVTPTNEDAAALTIGLDMYGSLGIGVANSRTDYVWQDDLLQWCRSIVEHVFAGRVAEIGKRSNALVRFGAEADAVSSGSAHLPVSWGAGRVRRFGAYGAATTT